MGDEPVFPVGATLDDGRIRITERIIGERWRGRYRAEAGGGKRFIVTTGGRQKGDLAQVRRDLAMNAPGVAALEHIGGLAGDDPHAHQFHGLVEVEPDGQPSSELELPLPPRVALGLASDLGRLLLRAREEGVVIGQLPVELIYVGRSATRRFSLPWRRTKGDERLRVTAILPRAPSFWRTAQQPSFALPQVFEYPMAAPEALHGKDHPAADSYVVALYAALLLTGEFPFEGASFDLRMLSLDMGLLQTMNLPPAIDRRLRPALDPSPDKRVPLRELCEALAAAATG